MNHIKKRLLALSATAAALVGVPISTAAYAQTAARTYSIPPQDLGSALRQFASQSGRDVVFDPVLTKGKTTRGVTGSAGDGDALRRILEGSGLTFTTTSSGFAIRGNGPAAEAAPSNEIVVTGTKLRKVQPLSPAISMSSKEIRDSGYATMVEALEQLPQNFKGGVSVESNQLTQHGTESANNNTFASSPNLRGLGPNSTLTLVNGMRLPSTAYAGSTDISGIPLSAIERVDVVMDGGSSIYGSDAVAGVVNIITKTKFTGIETGVQAFNLAEGKSADFEGYVLAGTSWREGGIVLDYDFQKNSPLFATDRSFTADALKPFSLLPRQTSNSVYGSLSQQLSTDTSASLTALYSDRHFNASSEESYGLVTDYGSTKQTAVQGQINHDFGADWNLNLSATYGRQNNDQTFDYPGVGPSPTRALFDNWTVEGRADGPVAALPGGDARLALGVAETWQRFRNVDSSNRAVSSSRHISSAYGELFVPLFGDRGSETSTHLSMDASARYDRYSDFGDTTNYKVGFEWLPVEPLTIRAGYSTAFKAPTLYETSSAIDNAYIVNARDPNSPSGFTTSLILDGTNPSLKPETAKDFYAGATLAPKNVGDASLTVNYFDVHYKNRIERLLTLDSYFVNFIVDANQLGSFVNLSPTSGQISNALNAPGRLIINFTGRPYDLASIKALALLGYENAAQTSAEGLDLTAHYGFPLGAGRISIDGNASYFIRYKEKFAPGTMATNVAGVTFNPARFRARLSAGWKGAGWVLLTRLNYTSGSRDPIDPACSTSGGCPVSPWVTLDASAGYSFDQHANLRAMRGVRIAIAVTNLFNAAPPFAFDGEQINYDPTNANPLGRTFSLAVTKRW